MSEHLRHDHSLKHASWRLPQMLGEGFVITIIPHRLATRAQLNALGYYPAGRWQVEIVHKGHTKWKLNKSQMTNGQFEINRMVPQQKKSYRFAHLQEIVDHIKMQSHE